MESATLVREVLCYLRETHGVAPVPAATSQENILKLNQGVIQLTSFSSLSFFFFFYLIFFLCSHVYAEIIFHSSMLKLCKLLNGELENLKL